MNAVEVLRRAKEEIRRISEPYEETAAMFSGGRDSLVVAHLAREADIGAYLLHLDTTISAPETQEFVQETAEHLGMRLDYARNPYGTFREAVLRWGFPTPGRRWCFWRLKLTAIREYVKEHPGLLLLTGLRRKESSRRNRLADEGTISAYRENKGSAPTFSPIFEWSGPDVRAYIEENLLLTNPVWDILHFSGECLCGAFQRKGELRFIRMASPRAFENLRSIENEFNENRRRKRPVTWQRSGATADGVADESSLDDFLCGSCQFKGVESRAIGLAEAEE